MIIDTEEDITINPLVIVLNDVTISYTNAVLNLGITMDTKLSFHSNLVCSNVFSRLCSLWPNSHILPFKTHVIGKIFNNFYIYVLRFVQLKELFDRFVYQIRRFESNISMNILYFRISAS